MQPKPWPKVPVSHENFRNPPREYGILPFWFLNGELDPEEMRYQLKEFRDKGMPGIILHGRYGLETPYIGPQYLERIRFAVEEAEKLGLKTWIYDEMNWPSGTADKRVLEARPDLAQRYIECINMTVRGPWFTYLTGADSRYLDFERSTPLAAYAVSSQGEVIDLTPNLSFKDVIPWEAPAGNWRLMYIVEKLADYYIDALDPESTKEFLRLGYDPYVEAVGGKMSDQMLGFYTDEPAMHYYLTGGDNPIVPWTKDMFRRFQERNGYNLRPHVPDLFFDIRPDSARIRYDFFNTLTEFYSQAFYQQIHEWCQEHNVLFTGHLLYEEWLRRMIRVEGNLFKHYPHMDVIGVDHLYPIVGNRDRPDEHVAMKVGSSAAHQLGSERLLCESFGGIFMDATMQRMKWIADWEYVLGVNLLNPHGYHYTLEGPRKRDWPPSMFYQYPWWKYYGQFSEYMSRLSHLLSGGSHVAKVAVLWPINAMFATYTPQARTEFNHRIEVDFNTLTDLLLRLHYDFDYLDEDMLAGATIENGTVQIRDEAYELLIVPPMAHIKLSTVECLEKFVQLGGKALGLIFLPDLAFAHNGQHSEIRDVSERMQALFGVDPTESKKSYRQVSEIELLHKDFDNGGRTTFLRSYALNRQLPRRLQEEMGTPGQPESAAFVIESEKEVGRYFYTRPDGTRQEITEEVAAERSEVAGRLKEALQRLIQPDIEIDNPEIFYLHRIKDGQDIFFLINSTQSEQHAQVRLAGSLHVTRWDPSTGEESLVAPLTYADGRLSFDLLLPPVGSVFLLTSQAAGPRIVDTNLKLQAAGGQRYEGYTNESQGYLVVEQDGKRTRLEQRAETQATPLTLENNWEFHAENENSFVTGKWLTAQEFTAEQDYARPGLDTSGWLPMVPGAWSYQLPAEPAQPYPIPVWYRATFQVDYLPEHVSMLVDGFAGSGWKLFVNGQAVPVKAVRSQVDAQMKAVEITPYLQKGENLLAIRLMVTHATDGILDLIKLMGHFSLEKTGEGSYRITAPRSQMQAGSWTEQGYPFYSGTGVYRQRFTLPADFAGQRVHLQAELEDDVLEVRLNGQSAGVRLWKPYEIDITGLLQPGENTLDLCTANTLINLLQAAERTSGLTGAVRLVPYHQFRFELSA